MIPVSAAVVGHRFLESLLGELFECISQEERLVYKS